MRDGDWVRAACQTLDWALIGGTGVDLEICDWRWGRVLEGSWAGLGEDRGAIRPGGDYLGLGVLSICIVSVVYGCDITYGKKAVSVLW